MPRDHEAHIWYIYHSGFAVKTAKHLLIFDYYRDNPAPSGNSAPFILQQARDSSVFVFASHGHADHYNQHIFDWKAGAGSIQYVLSHDINISPSREGVTIVHPGHKYHIGSLEVEALQSTDLGVAFLVSCDGLVIYHAGDLNWWHWEGEPDEDNAAMAENYKQQINLLAGRHIDLAFVPVDPRLEQQYNLGLVYLLQAVPAKMIFPMHFGDDYSIFARLKNDLPSEHLNQIAEITPACQHFVYK